MRLSNNLRSGLEVLLWSNDGDKTPDKHFVQHLTDIGDNKKLIEFERSIERSEYLSELTGKDVIVKPRRTDYSASREIAKATKYMNEFWNESCYSHDLLRNLFCRISRCISQRGMHMPVKELVVISEDIIPHIMSIDLVNTYAYTSVTKALARNELLVEKYHCGEITKAECADGLSKNTEYPVCDTVDDFLKILFKECYNYRFIFPKAVNKGVADAYSIGRQYRQGIGYHTGLTEDIIKWIDDGEIFEGIHEPLEPITVDDIKTELIEGDYHRQSFYAVDMLIERNADVNRYYLSRFDIETLQGVTQRVSREIVTDLKRAAIAVQSRR